MLGVAAHYTVSRLELQFPSSKFGHWQSNKYHDECPGMASRAGFLSVWDKMKAQPSQKKSLRHFICDS